MHSFLGGHSSGTFQEIISAAKANDLQFVVMTEHEEKDFDTLGMTLRGMHAGVLFVNGYEKSAENGDRSLVLPGYATRAEYEAASAISAEIGARGSIAGPNLNALPRLKLTDIKPGPRPMFLGMTFCPGAGVGSSAPNGVITTPGSSRSVANAGRSVNSVSPFVSTPVVMLKG